MYVENVKTALNKESFLRYLFLSRAQKLHFVEIKNANKGGCCHTVAITHLTQSRMNEKFFIHIPVKDKGE